VLRIEDGRDLRDNPPDGEPLDAVEHSLRTLRHHRLGLHC
jgi:hypothetical protein